MPLFDTHAHYNDDAFDQNRKGLLTPCRTPEWGLW